MAYDHKFTQDFWRASPERQVQMWKSNPGKLSPTMMKTIAPKLKEELRRSQDRLGNLQQLDKKWNSGSQSSDTYFQKGRVKERQGTVDKAAASLRQTMSDWRSSPSEKETAQKALKALTGQVR
jgi:hypothetical protein